MFKKILYSIFIFSLIFFVYQEFKPDSREKIVISEENVSIDEKSVDISYSLDERIARGDSYLEQGFVELARDEYIAALVEDDKNRDAYLKLSETQSLLKNYQGAVENLKHAGHIENSPEIQLELVKNHIHLFDYESALSRLKDLRGVFLESDYLLQSLELIYQTEIDPDFNVLNKDTYKKAQRLNQAFSDFKLGRGGQNIFLKALVAKAFIDNENYEIAQTLLNRIVTERKDYRDAWIMLGYVNIVLEDYEIAKDALNNAYDIDPVKPEIQFFLANVHEELGDEEEALNFYQLAYKNDYQPTSHVVQKLAELSLAQNYFQESFEFYAEFLKTSNEEVDLFIKPIWIAIEKLSDIKKAERMAEWARNSFPESAQSYNLLAWVELARGDLQKADSYLNQSFLIDPNFAAAHLNKGKLLERSGDIDEALRSYERAYQNDKDGSIGRAAALEYNRLLN